MTFLLGTFFRSVDLAVLRAASLLVSGTTRAEWLQEWKAELTHVRQVFGAEQGFCLPAEREVMCFCAGALKDAIYLRIPSQADLTSTKHSASLPWQCLMWMAGLATVLYCGSLCLPGVRSVSSEAYHDPHGLTLVTNGGHSVASLKAAQFRLWKSRNQKLFSSFAFYRPLNKWVTFAPHQSEQLAIAQSTKNLFELQGLQVLQTQHSSTSQEELPKLIISDEVWKRRFGRDSKAFGTIIRIGLRRVEVAGVVATQQWRLPGTVDAWLLEPDEDASAIPSNASGFVIASLDPSAIPHPFSYRWEMSAPSLAGRMDAFMCESISNQTQGPVENFVFCFLLALLALPATTSLPLGDYPAAQHGSWSSMRFRRWGFLVSKFALILPIVYFGSLDLAHYRLGLNATTSVYIQLFCGFCASLLALRWVLRDQRKRCPVCLCKLTHPARVGEPSRNFLAWNGTELMCADGHGLLHVPEISTSWFATQRWLHLDPSWNVLFTKRLELPNVF